MREKTAVSIKEDFIIPEFVAVHWDTKIVQHSCHAKSERLAILISGIPSSIDGKLLSVPKIPDATGHIQSRTKFDILCEWQIQPNVIALVFNTIASNSEWINGACKNVEELLNQRLLWCASATTFLNEFFVGFSSKYLEVQTLQTMNWLEHLKTILKKYKHECKLQCTSNFRQKQIK